MIRVVLLAAAAAAPVWSVSTTAAHTSDKPQASPETIQTVFSNPTPITISTAGPTNAVPYPSTITVAGLSGSIPFIPGKIRVTLHNFSHTFPGDLALVLEAPGGQRLLLQAAVGAGSDISNVTYTFSDSGAAFLPNGDPWTGGTYRPSSYGVALSFPAPGPGTDYNMPGPFAGAASLASTFGGTNPNGVWKLFVRDYFNDEGGAIAGGWSLAIDTTFLADRAVLDFDGDGKTDDALVRSEGGNLNWYLLRSTAGFSGTTWGLGPGDELVPEDYDADGRWDIAVFRAGVFYILLSSTSSLQVVNFGQAGDDPLITQDFDGDGRADPSVVRQEGDNLVFYLLRSTLGFTGVTFGRTGSDRGIRGDFNGDGRADIAVYRDGTAAPANSFIVLPSDGGPVRTVNFGLFSSDFILPGDFDGDHKTDCAVWRGFGSGTGTWYWLRSSDGALNSVDFGTRGLDFPVPGDYDGDGRTDPAVWRPTAPAAFFHLRSSEGFSAARFGTSGDIPPGYRLQVR
jgi:subtilisin-like proprotein convertase family protein